jgi:hypothetical protein
MALLLDWAGIPSVAAKHPVKACKDENCGEEDGRVVHLYHSVSTFFGGGNIWVLFVGTNVIRGNRHSSWQDENDADECRPRAGVDVDERARTAHVPWSFFEFLEDEFAAGSVSRVSLTRWR